MKHTEPTQDRFFQLVLWLNVRRTMGCFMLLLTGSILINPNQDAIMLLELYTPLTSVAWAAIFAVGGVVALLGHGTRLNAIWLLQLIPVLTVLSVWALVILFEGLSGDGLSGVPFFRLALIALFFAILILWAIQSSMLEELRGMYADSLEEIHILRAENMELTNANRRPPA